MSKSIYEKAIMKRREILLNEFLKEEEREIDNMKKKELSMMIDELLEKVEEVMDFIIYEFDEVEREEHMKEYLEALSYMDYVLYGLQLK